MHHETCKGTSGWAHLCLGLALLLGDLVGAGPKLRPVLTFTTHTRTPILIGVPELVPSSKSSSATPRYYRRLVFSGERQSATGELLGRPNECAGVSGSGGITPRQSRRQLRGQISYAYDPANDGVVLNYGAYEHSTVLSEAPWPSNSCNPPPSPLPLGFPVSEVGVPIPYSGSGLVTNNPLRLAVISPTRAADPDVAGYADYIGDGFHYYPTHYRDAFVMELRDEDTSDEAERRARVTTVVDERTFALQSSLQGDASKGPRWTIREISVREALESSCPGSFMVTRSFERRPIGAASTDPWERMPDELTQVEVRSGGAIEEYELPLQRGYEIRLTGVVYEGIPKDCPACVDSDETGNPGGFGGSPFAHSIDWHLTLGPGPGGRSVGTLSLSYPGFTPALYSPAALRPFVDRTLAEIIKSPVGAVRQVVAPFELVDVVVTGEESYEVRFFHRAQVQSKGADGVYGVSGSPYVVWRVGNPQPGRTGFWRVTRLLAGREIVTEIDESQPGRRLFSEGNGLRVTETVTTSRGDDREEAVTVRDATGLVASKSVRVYRTFTWGEELVRETLDPEGAMLTTEWEFLPAANPRVAGRPARIRHPDGSSETFAYDAGTGALLTSTRPFLDRVATTSVVRETRDLDGDGWPDSFSTRRREAGPGWLVEIGFEIEWGGSKERSVVRAGDPAAAWNALSNRRVDERYFAAGPLRGQVNYRREADGSGNRREVAALPDGTLRVVDERGAFAADGKIADGTRVIETRSPRGVVTESRSEDIASGLLLGVTKVESFDEWGRVLALRRPDGTVERRFYCDTCGGLDAVEINGVTRRFTYDALGRKIEERVTAGTTLIQHRRFSYDAADRLVRVARVESSAGTETALVTTRFDLAGRVVEHAELGQPAARFTHSLIAGGGALVSTTFPNGATRHEYRSAAGEWTSVQGTAVHPVDRAWAPRPDGKGGYALTLRWPNQDGTSRTQLYAVNLLGDEDVITFGDGARFVRAFDAMGRVVRETDPDGVSILRAYDPQGNPAVFAIDTNRDGLINYAGTDKVIRLTRSVVQREGLTVWRRRAEVWPKNGRDEPVEVASWDDAVDGTRSWQTQSGLTSFSTRLAREDGETVQTRTEPDGRVVESRVLAGRPIGWRERHPLLGDLAGADFEYDESGRLRQERDVRGRVMTFSYDASDRLVAIAAPDPDPQAVGAGADPRITRFEFDTSGRIVTVAHPDGRVVNLSYWPEGLLRRRWGSGAIPVEYGYDRQGRLVSLTTWRDFTSDQGRATTVWRYSNERGFLLGKSYADGIAGPAFAYSPAGRLVTRRWSRGLTTTYLYGAAGDLAGWDYSDSTPKVRLERDRLGRILTREDGAGRSSQVFHATTSLATAETISVSGLGSVTLSRGFDELLRVSRVGLSGVAAGQDALYSYDPASRVATVALGDIAAKYDYPTASRAANGLAFSAAGIASLRATIDSDRLDRIRSLNYSVPGIAEPQWTFGLTRDRLGRLVAVSREDGSRIEYLQDSAGRVSGESWRSRDGAPIIGRQFAWSFDDVGNLQWSDRNAQTSFFTVNALNQYVSRTVPGIVEVSGRADPAATVTVESAPEDALPVPAERRGEYFFRRLAFDNTATAVRALITVTGSRLADVASGGDALSSVRRTAYLPRSPERFAYDADGNLLADGAWSYSWDGENRLVAVETSASRVQLGEARRRVVFTYDAIGRRAASVRTTFVPAGFGRLLQARFVDGNLTGPPLETTDSYPEPAADWFSASGTRGTAGARISGILLVPVEGDWTLALEGAGFSVFRLFLDGQLVLDRTSDAVPPSVKRRLAAGSHDLKIEFVALARLLDLRLMWSNGGALARVPSSMASAWAPQSVQRRWIYDGWRPLLEYDPLSSTYWRAIWGTDVSGGLEGAAGVGGLLMSVNEVGRRAVVTDPRGGVAGLVDMADGRSAARYDYGAFGELIASEGNLAGAQPLGFATRPTEPDSGLVYHGFRYYQPATGRWLSRDPQQEEGGLNLYSFVQNTPTYWTDPIGLALYAFDGTGNDGYRDRRRNAETNVFVLYNLYDGYKSYEAGVGTNDGPLNPFGAAFGFGGLTRIETMLERAEQFARSGDSVADIVGFSRGAAQARSFANLLRERIPCVRIRWMGLFDTVASEGLPNDVNLGYSLGVPRDAGAGLHLTAGGERRRTTFALTSIRPGPDLPPPNGDFREIEIPGAVHSDVGGGYESNRGLANFALLMMWQDGRDHAVPFRAIPNVYSDLVGSPHDSRWLNDRLVEWFTGQPRVRKVYYHP
jgi:RHS repeat-associated protein